MHTNRSFSGIACRVAAFSFLMAGTASLMHAQQASSSAPSANAPLLLASSSAPDFAAAYFGSSSGSSSSSSDTDTVAPDRMDFGSSALSAQPAPRRRYGRPNYSNGNTNADGSNKYTLFGGAGASVPVGDTHFYETPSWDFQVGAGRNFNKNLGVNLQFDYDHFGLQGATIANQSYLYDYGCPGGTISGGTCGVSGLDGNNHVWSFTLDPTFTLATEGSMGAYAVVGGGFYHKVTNFEEPGTGEYCDPYYGCYQYTANQVIDHYTSNAGGVNGGIGLTYKFSRFSNERFYVEGRYVVVFNQARTGLTAFNVGTTFGSTYNGYDYYPANSHRTTYIPIVFGIRF
jgi:hypothetical protein